tara:strand:+ start:3071 stop:3916 length:846 start_codon:yes stop_codon:yes gene_type:complete
MTPYSKLNSQGNDFILIEKHKIETKLTRDMIENYCSRDSIGCDQLFIIDTSDKSNIKCEVYNQDGSIACQCGNGIRATMLYLNKKYDLCNTNIIICNRPYHSKIKDDLIYIDMGMPNFMKCPYNEHISLSSDGIITSVDDKDSNINFSFIPLSIGNEHSVVFSANCLKNKDSISKILKKIFGYEMNIGFIENAKEFLNNSESIVKLTVNERGAGYTESCGSGATAAAICLFRLFELENKHEIDNYNIKIQQKGGILEVTKNHLNSFELIGPSSYDGDGYLE